MNLETLGWNSFFEEAFSEYRKEGLLPARVAREERKSCLTYGDHDLGEDGVLTAEIPGRLIHQSADRSELPVVGDWVALEPRPGG